MPYREIAYRDFAMSDAIVHGTRETLIPDSSMKPPVELLPVVPDRCHASFQMDGPDYVGISHIMKSTFLMSSDFVISKSRSSMPLH
jgi:hypothetical protein